MTSNQTIASEKIEVFTNTAKALLQVFLGVVLLLLIFAPLGGGIMKFFLFIIGGSFIYMSRGGLSSKPQIILDKECLYVGYKIKRKFKWSSVVGAKITKEKVDFRNVDFLTLRVKASKNGRAFAKTIELPIHLLDIEPDELLDLILEWKTDHS